MGQVIGYLREDMATHGEKLVLRKLRDSLPDDFTVYVECPLQHHRIQRFPDFIVLFKFGVVVLEVKDWVTIMSVDRYGATIRRRDGVINRRKNPVLEARDCATLLASELQTIPQLLGRRSKVFVPWGYAAILPNLHASVIAQIRDAWGEAYVLGAGDLEPHVVAERLRATLPFERALRMQEIEFVRGVINPSILIVPEEPDEKPPILLDGDQERIVTEADRTRLGRDHESGQINDHRVAPTAHAHRTAGVGNHAESRQRVTRFVIGCCIQVNRCLGGELKAGRRRHGMNLR